MLEKDVELSYVCTHCRYSVTVKLKCSGEGVAAGPHAAASVPIACPTCDNTSAIYFELSGLILNVVPEERMRILQPSLN